jgi:SAM-dependent methyltransferase
MPEDYISLVKTHILDEAAFARATFSGTQRGQTMSWLKLVIRPVMLKNARHLQFSYFDAKKDVTKNYAGDEALDQLEQALDLPFANYTVQTTNGDVQVRITKKGKPFISQSKSQSHEVELSHDREKAFVLPANAPDPYLRAVGIMTTDGKIKANMQSKFKQINEFLKLLTQTGELEKLLDSPVRILDCGCGNAYLTFAAYHYLTHTLGLQVEMTGIDVNASLLASHMEKIASLGWTDLNFQPTKIIDFQPSDPPDIVLALHACDTATDEAIAQGIKWGSKLIVCAPCCQHNLQDQLEKAPTPPAFAPMLRYGLLHERLGDVLTDSFRVLLLRLMGYRVDVIEFVSGDHTPKNLMIRAVKSSKAGHPRLVSEYQNLRDYWLVTPYLEQLLENELQITLS